MWQLIETAPRDEEQEILVCSYDEVTASDGRLVELYTCDVVTWVTWADEGRGGWYNGDVAQDSDGYSHWQPLPPPPRS